MGTYSLIEYHLCQSFPLLVPIPCLYSVRSLCSVSSDRIWCVIPVRNQSRVTRPVGLSSERGPSRRPEPRRPTAASRGVSRCEAHGPPVREVPEPDSRDRDVQPRLRDLVLVRAVHRGDRRGVRALGPATRNRRERGDRGRSPRPDRCRPADGQVRRGRDRRRDPDRRRRVRDPQRVRTDVRGVHRLAHYRVAGGDHLRHRDPARRRVVRRGEPRHGRRDLRRDRQRRRGARRVLHAAADIRRGVRRPDFRDGLPGHVLELAGRLLLYGESRRSARDRLLRPLWCRRSPSQAGGDEGRRQLGPVERSSPRGTARSCSRSRTS